MLVALISVAWLIVACVGLAMCRLAALSDESHLEALSEWIATSCVTEEEVPADDAAQRSSIDARFRAYRATG